MDRESVPRKDLFSEPHGVTGTEHHTQMMDKGQLFYYQYPNVPASDTHFTFWKPSGVAIVAVPRQQTTGKYRDLSPMTKPEPGPAALLLQGYG